jgi:hypothetical protein
VSQNYSCWAGMVQKLLEELCLRWDDKTHPSWTLSACFSCQNSVQHAVETGSIWVFCAFLMIHILWSLGFLGSINSTMWWLQNMPCVRRKRQQENRICFNNGLTTGLMWDFFCNPILFAICTSTFSKLCKKRIQWHVEECSLVLLCN